MAAAEALLESADPAALSLFSIVDPFTNEDIVSVRIPALLSLLAYNQLSGRVLGVNELQATYEKQYGPGNYIPPMIVNYWTFRIMIGVGFLMLAIAAYVLLQVMRRKPLAHPRLIALLPFAIALPYLANSAGWILTEVGRQPWVVFGLLKTQDAVSPILTPGLVLFSLIGFTLLYGGLMGADVYLLNKFARLGPESVETADVDLSETEDVY
jgi:cytochrome d ubiquinol oxidase subunit I